MTRLTGGMKQSDPPHPHPALPLEGGGFAAEPLLEAGGSAISLPLRGGGSGRGCGIRSPYAA